MLADSVTMSYRHVEFYHPERFQNLRPGASKLCESLMKLQGWRGVAARLSRRRDNTINPDHAVT